MNITPAELKARMDAGDPLFIVDVREPFEFGDWHMPGAVNVPISHFMSQSFEPNFPKDSKIVTVCAHGFRSATASRVLSGFGYDVSSLQGGMVEWNGIYDFVEIPSGVYSLRIIQVRRVGKGCLSYILISNNKAIVIDPTIDAEIYSAVSGVEIVAVLDTHLHADHASGGRNFARSGIRYYAPGEVGAGSAVSNGSVVQFGSAAILVIAAPGHTPGSVVYKLNDFIFTGDTILAGSVGRVDLGQTASDVAPVLYDTLQKLMKLPDHVIALPGHCSPEEIEPKMPVRTTIEYMKETFDMPKEPFVRLASASIQTPENFELIKRYNLGEIRIDTKDEFRELEASANRCSMK